MTRPRLLSTSTLRHTDVVNAQGEDLGDLKDLMVDLDTGSIAYAVLSFGGVLGMGNKLFAVPFESLRTDTERERLVLDVPKARLEQAPGFDEDHWPEHADHSFLDQVYTHYGYDRYDAYRQDRYSGYYERRRKAREGTMLDVIDPKHDGVS